MEITVHRGTHQIGGCVTEIKSKNGTKIVIDIGENLPTADGIVLPELKVEGLTEGNPDYKAVFVTHYHGDHIGMYNKIPPQIPIYIGEVSKEIFKIFQKYLLKYNYITQKDMDLINNFNTYKIPDTIQIDDILIKPIEVDHSAFNSHMLLIECDGKKVLHTGDFRLHGPRGKAVIPALKKYVGEVDCLICEGTTLSRPEKKAQKETELQKEAEKIFRENKNSFVMCSSTNIDRIAVLHKAALKAGRFFVCDDYQKEILMYIDSIARSELYKFKNRVCSYDTNILKYMEEKGFVMLVRANQSSKRVMEKFPNHVFVYSEWEGYIDEKNKDNKNYERIREFVPKDYIYLHTSGHADRDAIEKVCNTVKPKILIPIHGENPKDFEKVKIDNCKINILKDGESIEI